MNQQAYFMNQDSDQQNNQNNMNPIIVCSQLAQGMMGAHPWPQFPAQYMAANGMMDPVLQDQISQRFMQELKMFQEMMGKQQDGNNQQSQQFPFNPEYLHQMRNYFMEHAKDSSQQNGNNMAEQMFQEMFMRLNYQKMHEQSAAAGQGGVRKIGSYSLEERAKKIKKYKDKLLRWKLAHPISRSFSGRSKVANKKPRVKGRFVKNDDDDQTNNSMSDDQNNNKNMEKEQQSSIETIQDIDRKQNSQLEEEETATVENPENQGDINCNNINKMNVEK